MSRTPGRPRFPFPIPLLLVAVAAGACRIEPTPAVNGQGEGGSLFAAQIHAMLEGSAAAWNRGDLSGFMTDYHRAPGTSYIGGPGLVRGWDSIQARYDPYFGPGAERDSLRFDLLETRALGARHGLALIRYTLYRPGGAEADSAGAADTAAPADSAASEEQEGRASDERVTSTGLVTLVLQQVEGRWEIVHDHSSEMAPPTSDSTGPASDSSGAARDSGGAPSGSPPSSTRS